MMLQSELAPPVDGRPHFGAATTGTATNLLDLQALTPESGVDDATDGGVLLNGGGSRASLLLCGDSSLSLVTCD
jgi:hypothetical protein